MTYSGKTKSAGGIIINESGQVLVVSQHGLSWSLPKGHVEENESLLDAAYREIEEETGLTTLRYIDYLGHYWRYKLNKDGSDDTSEEKNLHFFLFTSSETRLNPQDSDNPEAKWLNINEVSQYLSHKKDKEFFDSVKYKLLTKSFELISISSTCSTSEEAHNIAKHLIQNKLAACCQISGPITSYYNWKNNLETSIEYKLIIKSTKKNFAKIEALIKTLHGYEIPEITTSDIEEASLDYTAWFLKNI